MKDGCNMTSIKGEKYCNKTFPGSGWVDERIK